MDSAKAARPGAVTALIVIEDPDHPVGEETLPLERIGVLRWDGESQFEGGGTCRYGAKGG
jgi:hypothetical protein